MQNRSLSVQAPRQLTAAEADLSAGALSAQQIIGQITLIQQIMDAAMKKDHHYGTIPGCGEKPALFKPGAEKLCLTFHLSPTYDVTEEKGEHGHREYRVTCTLTARMSGVVVGEGLGSCSTMESKYRYRGSAAEETDQPVPRNYWDVRKENPAKAQELIGGKGFTAKKIEGKGWMICKSTGERLENPDLADQYNTVLKMAKKRALVDAVLTATAASDIFAQDLEDLAANAAARYPERQDREDVPSRRHEAHAQEAEIVEEVQPVRPVRGIIHSVEEKTTANKGKKVFIVIILDANGSDLKASTFSKTLADKAQDFATEGTEVIAGVKNAKQPGYFNLESLESAENVDADEGDALAKQRPHQL